jgi:Putative zinc-finger
MECRDVREMADSFLGEELLTETNHEILRHLDTCPVCRADLSGRRALREGVQRAFHRAPELGPGPEFIARLRTTLQDTTHQGSARRGLRFQGWWALAATVLLAVALGVVYRGRDWITATGALARAAVGDHRYCALQFRLPEKPISLEEAAQRYDAAYRVLENLPPDDVMTAVGPAHVLERHACVYEGQRFAHIVFTYRGERVSLLVTAVDGSVIPTLPGETLPRLTSPSRIDGMSVVSFRTSRQMVFFAGDVVQNDLLKLAEAVGEPLYRGLAAPESAGARRLSWTNAVEDIYALDLGIVSSPAVSVYRFVLDNRAQ